MATDFNLAFAAASGFGMNRVLLALGMFVFGLDTLAFEEFQRRRDWRHASTERFGARPASQFVGPGMDTVTLSGLLIPEIAGSFGAIDRLEEMAGTGENWPLVDGFGRIWGDYRIVALDITGSSILAGGIARVTDFTVNLERVD